LFIGKLTYSGRDKYQTCVGCNVSKYLFFLIRRFCIRYSFRQPSINIDSDTLEIFWKNKACDVFVSKSSYVKNFLFYYNMTAYDRKRLFLCFIFCLSCLTKRIIHAVREVSVKVDYIYFYFYYYAQWFILWIKMRKEWSFILLRVIKENLKLIYISYLSTQLLHAKNSGWKKGVRMTREKL